MNEHNIRLDQRKRTSFLRLQYLMNMVKRFPKLWRMPNLKMSSRDYPHHSDAECERRRNQQQYRNQVRMDLETKRQPA